MTAPKPFVVRGEPYEPWELREAAVFQDLDRKAACSALVVALDRLANAEEHATALAARLAEARQSRDHALAALPHIPAVRTPDTTTQNTGATA